MNVPQRNEESFWFPRDASLLFRLRSILQFGITIAV